MESYYEINVSLKGRHLFATAQRSLKTQAEADSLLGVFKVKFPEREGYKISMTYWEGKGTIMPV